MPTSSYTRIMLKVVLFDISTVPFLTPPITEDITMPVSILRRRQASHQKVTEPKKG
jgi:hypothetical protein